MDGIFGHDAVRNHVSRIIAKLLTNDRIQAVEARPRRCLVYWQLCVAGETRLRANLGPAGTYCVGFSLTSIVAATIMTLRHSRLATGTMQRSWVRVVGDHFARDADKLDREFLQQVEATHLGSIRCLTRDKVLHWQGDPGEYVFVVSTGSLKEYKLLDGRAYAYPVLGPGGLAGAIASLLGHDHDTITQALHKVKVIALQLPEFDGLLTRERSHDICPNSQ
jgi:hypothetical protein